MNGADPGLRFWLHHIEAGGGLWEPAGDSTLAVLPPDLARRYRLDEEIVVTDDPDVARADGVMFLGTGHPVLMEAAEAVLNTGDAGIVVLQPPAGLRPDADVLEGQARSQLPVSHGRVDLVGPAVPTIHWVMRVTVMVNYALSTEDHFTERVERWVHVPTRREVPAAVVTMLERAVHAEDGLDEWPPTDQLGAALVEADRLIAVDALRRRTDLGRQMSAAHDEERARATTYYADALAGIERRVDAAPADRRVLLEARLTSTREEQARRLAEIAEKYQAQHEIRPYRLHAIGVPAVRVPFDVRRGERRYRLELDWLAPARAFAQPRCPACAATAPLVAGKNNLGCLLCMATKAPAAAPPAAPRPPAPRPKPVPDAAPPARIAPPTAATRSGTNAAATNGQAATSSPAKTRQQAARPPVANRKAGSAGTVESSAAPKRADAAAATLWNAVAAGRARDLRNVLVADSPLAALCAAYGSDGVKHALGLPLREDLVQFSVGSDRVGNGWGTTTGAVITTHNEYQFLARWHEDGRALAIAEVLPFRPYADGRFPHHYWRFENRNPYRIVRIPEPATRLDDVATALLTHGGPWHGLALTARALAAWWRLSDHHQQLHDLHRHVDLAAAVHRLVAVRAGDKGLFRDTVQTYQAEETTTRKADARLRKLLDLGTDRAW